MATTLTQLVEKVLLRLGEGHSEATKTIYRYEIESFVPEAIARLYTRLNQMGNTSDLEVTETYTLDSDGKVALNDALVLESLMYIGTGYVVFTDGSTNNNLPISYEPNFENRFLKRSNPALYYYALKTYNGDNLIYVYQGDGSASPAANVNIEVLGIVIPTDISVLSSVNVARLVDILVEMCKEKLGTDQVPDVAPSNIPIKPVGTPTGQ